MSWDTSTHIRSRSRRRGSEGREEKAGLVRPRRRRAKASRASSDARTRRADRARRQVQTSVRGGGLGGVARSALRGTITAAVRPAHSRAGERNTSARGAKTRRILPAALPPGNEFSSRDCCCFAAATAWHRLHIVSGENVRSTARPRGSDCE